MKNKLAAILGTVLVVAGVGALGYLYYDARQEVTDLKAQVAQKDQKIEQYKTNPEAAAQEEVNRYIREVGELYALPEDEQPSVATVNDKEKLKDQPFFANAENGDVTLIYAKSKLAILYRPSTKQLIKVSSVTINEE